MKLSYSTNLIIWNHIMEGEALKDRKRTRDLRGMVNHFARNLIWTCPFAQFALHVPLQPLCVLHYFHPLLRVSRMMVGCLSQIHQIPCISQTGRSIPGGIDISKVHYNFARINRSSSQARFFPGHLCGPRKKGLNAVLSSRTPLFVFLSHCAGIERSGSPKSRLAL